MLRILIIFFLTQLACLAQNKSQIFCGFGNKKLYYVEQTESVVKIYVLNSWYSKFGLSKEMILEDTLSLDIEENIYSSDNYKVNLKNSRIFLKRTDTDKEHIKLKTVKDKDLFLKDIQDGYWWMLFFEFESSLQYNYPPCGIGFQEVYKYLNELKSKENSYEKFKILCQQKIEILKDSLGPIFLKNVKSISDSVLQNLSTIDSKTLKHNLLNLPNKKNTSNRYFNKIIDSICIKRSELLFELLEIAPDMKEQIFISTLYNKQNYVAIKKSKTKSNFRAELIKRRRKEIYGSVITGSTIIILEVVIISGIVYLFVK